MQRSPAIDRITRRLAAAGFPVVVEESDDAIVLTGVVDTAESREAVIEIAASEAPDRRLETNLEVEPVLPTEVDAFVSEEPSAELADSVEELAARGGQLEPDFADQRLLTDPVAAPGPSSSGPDDPAGERDDIYTPPSDPVITTDARGQARVLGGFEDDSMRALEADRSDEENQPGDEALADAIRRELREDAATTELQILVAVRRGVAHLRGRVPGPEDAENAEEVASRVPGVREVVEELEVPNL